MKKKVYYFSGYIFLFSFNLFQYYLLEISV